MNYKTDTQRKELTSKLKTLLDEKIEEYEETIGINNSSSVKDYNNFDRPYKITAGIRSEKINTLCFTWIPDSNELYRTFLSVKEKGQGIGSLMTKMSEEIADSLDAQLIMKEVVPKSRSYWANHPNYELKDGNAYRIK